MSVCGLDIGVAEELVVVHPPSRRCVHDCVEAERHDARADEPAMPMTPAASATADRRAPDGPTRAKCAPTASGTPPLVTVACRAHGGRMRRERSRSRARRANRRRPRARSVTTMPTIRTSQSSRSPGCGSNARSAPSGNGSVATAATTIAIGTATISARQRSDRALDREVARAESQRDERSACRLRAVAPSARRVA